MEAGCQRLKGHEGAPSSLNEAIDSLRLARGEASLKPAKDVLSSASTLLTTIRVGLLPVYVSRLLANVCRTRLSMKRALSN